LLEFAETTRAGKVQGRFIKRQKGWMEIVHKKCEHCDKKFKKTDEVVDTDGDLVHTDCLYDYLIRGTLNTYYDSYEEYVKENK